MKKLCLLLNNNKKKDRLGSYLKKKFKVKSYQKIPSKKDFKESDFILSFGFRKIIKQSILSKLKRPIINIHLSYLPYNRGAHPNFWSLIKKKPSGISIHEVDKGIDTGKIILRKKINFNIYHDKFSTFKKTYDHLHLEAEKLFIKNFHKIYNNKYKKKSYKIKRSFHKKKDLPKWMVDWNMSIADARKIFYKKSKPKI